MTAGPGLPDLQNLHREQVISLRPFTVRRVARWSECDPAGVVYTGNFADYFLSAVSLFRRNTLGQSWNELRASAGVDTPAKSVGLVFNGSLWPDDVFDIVCHVGDIRTRTFDLLARASRVDSGASIFDGKLSMICVSAQDRKIAVPIEADLRRLLEACRNEWPAPDDLISKTW